MKRNTILLAVLCLCAMTFARVAAAQNINLNGNWKVTIHTTDKTMEEQWTIKHEGSKITGTAKNDKGEHQLSGTVDGNVVRALEKEGDMNHQVHLTVDGDDMDGTIRMGKNEFLIMMKKVK